MALWHLFGTKQKGCHRFAMRLPSECYQMHQTIQYHLPHLRESQSLGLTLWVYGAIVMGSACQNAVATALSFMGSFDTMRQYLRQWLYDGQHRPRPTATQIDVESCFAPLLRWVLSLWQSDRLALAIDPTMKGDQLSSIVISVVYRSCAIPIAWHVLAANRPGGWIAPTLRLLDMLSDAVPDHMSVLVMCDRGLRSRRLWKKICSVGFHPCVRQSINTVFCPQGGTRVRARHLVPGPNHAYVGYGTAFRDTSKRRVGTMIVVWVDGADEPWLVMTDLSADADIVCWYALRFWIELGFRALKTLGFQWNKTRRTDPQRVSRHWLVLSVATLMTMAYGSRVEDAADAGRVPGNLRAPPKCLPATHRSAHTSSSRSVSVFRLGIFWLRRLLHRGRMWKRVWLLPEQWPKPPPEMKIIQHAVP